MRGFIDKQKRAKNKTNLYNIREPTKGENMQFQPTSSRGDSNMTSNKSHLLTEAHEQEIKNITPDLMSQTFGPGQDVNIPEKGYTDPEWYFKGPGGSVLGIGFRWGRPRLYAKNITNQFIPPQEVCETFVEQVLYCIELEQEDREENNGGEQ